MESKRIVNFNPGPAALPLPVLEEIRADLPDYKGAGLSVLEMSHRSQQFEAILNEAIARTRRLLKLDERFHVIFVQGGASLQFSMIPMNFLADGRSADYVDTGTWSTHAIKEARVLQKPIRVVASSEESRYTRIPQPIAFSPDAVYAHITSNNTIRGTQWQSFPDARGVPLVADMSSDIMSRPFDAAPFGLIYAGAQKNIGPAGVTLVIVRADLLERVPENLPTMLKYTTYTAKNSLYNTPPCFAIYTLQLVLKWIEEAVGGLERIDALNREKAGLVYRRIDASGGFYRGTAEPGSRSLMNVTFRLPTEELEKRFIEEAARSGLAGLKGHRSVGGCRASLYNAVPLEGVDALAQFMQEFARRNG
ncbi:MAG: 3-phosphoserine/phosphohydroxythreonine transaminase [Desulfobacterales bacterium]|jgi:phosphoserine aminotransferase|nr:3-phosphoserine/phosphohydroxythreonine transaminase [Desulfobacterales bacterium]